MPTEGIIVIVIREGIVRKGDPIEILSGTAEAGNKDGAD